MRSFKIRLTNRGYPDEGFEKRYDWMPANRARSKIDRISTERFFQTTKR